MVLIHLPSYLLSYTHPYLSTLAHIHTYTIPKAFPHFHIKNNLTEKEKKRRSLTNKSIKDTNKEYKKKITMTAIILVLDLLHAGGDTLVYQHLRRNVPPPLNTPDLTKTNNIINNKKTEHLYRICRMLWEI